MENRYLINVNVVWLRATDRKKLITQIFYLFLSSISTLMKGKLRYRYYVIGNMFSSFAILETSKNKC